MVGLRTMNHIENMPPPKRKRRKRRSKASLSVRKKPVIVVDKYFLRLFDSRKKVVYFIRGNKAHRYPFHRSSRILYIGKTERTGARPFESLRENAPELLKIHGMKNLEIVYIEAPARQNVDIATKLETACLHQFREYYGNVPRANKRGSRILELSDERRYVNLQRVTEILKELS
jgi:hypothetical protein